jgi:threonine aldolase
VVVEETAHIVVSELGGAAANGGLQVHGVRGDRGRISSEQIRETMHEDGSFHTPRTSVVALENTHNNAGGTVWPLDELREVTSTARVLGLKLHLDGARLMNAAVASQVPASDFGSLFDTVTLCLSKGLGCPLGALIAGSAELMHRARMEKHRMGGAMRQAGIVAAAGIYALDHNVERLVEDHARARRLAEAWAEQGLPVDLERVQTNFVHLEARALGLGEWEAVGLVRDTGVAISRTMRPGFLRAVTHLDLTDDDIDRAAELVPQALGAYVHA